jgi:hypothetical protein
MAWWAAERETASGSHVGFAARKEATQIKALDNGASCCATMLGGACNRSTALLQRLAVYVIDILMASNYSSVTASGGVYVVLFHPSLQLLLAASFRPFTSLRSLHFVTSVRHIRARHPRLFTAQYRKEVRAFSARLIPLVLVSSRLSSCHLDALFAEDVRYEAPNQAALREKCVRAPLPRWRCMDVIVSYVSMPSSNTVLLSEGA